MGRLGGRMGGRLVIEVSFLLLRLNLKGNFHISIFDSKEFGVYCLLKVQRLVQVRKYCVDTRCVSGCRHLFCRVGDGYP